MVKWGRDAFYLIFYFIDGMTISGILNPYSLRFVLALDIKERWGESGPVKPKHIREAVRLMKEKNNTPHCGGKRLFLNR